MKKFSTNSATFYAEPGFILGDEEGPAITTGLAHTADGENVSLLSVFDGARLSEVMLTREEAVKLANDLVAAFALDLGGAA